MAARVLVQISTEDLAVSVRAEAVAALGRIMEARSKVQSGTSEGQAPTD
jgi:hypothetical protein